MKPITITSRRRQRSGSVMIEFALGAMMLTFAFTGTFQFGWTFYQYNVLQAAVDNGAKYASVIDYNGPCSSANPTPTTDYLTHVQNMAVYGDPQAPTGSTPVLNGLTTGNVTVTVSCSSSSGTYMAVPTYITVAISGYTINSVFANQSLNGKPFAKYPYTGLYQPY